MSATGAKAEAARPRRTVGLRREVAILLPACLVLLVALSTYTLFSYRSAVERLVEERRAEALRAARAVAGQLAALPAPPDATALGRLRRASPALGGAAWLDPDGAVRLADGELVHLDRPATGAASEVPEVRGPSAATGGAVVAFAPLPGERRRGMVRVDLPVPLLTAQARSLRVLTAVVLFVDVAVVLLALSFLRHLMAPYDALLARARAVGQHDDEDDADEVAFLVRTFERGMTALATAGGEAGDGELETLQRALGGSLESGLLLLDREGCVLALNPPGAEILGVPPPPPGARLDTVLEGHPQLATLLSAAVTSGEAVQRREVELSAESGRTVGLTLHPLRRAAPREGEADSGGTVDGARGFLVLFADLTDARRRAEESRLADSLVQLGEMAAGIAHELRNSLATMRGYLSLLERDPHDRGDHLAEMRREADHVQRVLDDFLLFAHPGSLRLEPLRLGTLLARAAADPVLADVEVRLPLGSAAEETLLGDAQLLERALRNLLHNAAQASQAARAAPEDPPVRGGDRPAAVVDVESRRDGEAVEVSIADRGPGLPPALRGELFLPFVTTRRGGVGLGLSLAHRIVALHGGTVALEDRPGGGATARVRLPLGRSVTDGSIRGPARLP